MENEYLNKLHQEILSIMDEIHNICETNGITYYLIGGTLLGAVRHGGFIPWDDDLDIAMPREDFEKFRILCSKELPNNLEFIWFSTEKKYWLPFAKIAKKGTLFLEESNIGAQRPYGIFVDIFPLDSTEGYSKRIQKRSNIIKKIKVALFFKSGARKVTGFKKLIKLIPINVLQILLYNLMTKDANKKCEWYSNYASQYSIKKQTMPKLWYGDGELIPYCGRMYRVPCESSKVLRSIFGNKYMELPPMEKRKTHYPSKVLFSNGEEMNFNSNQIKLSVEESLHF